MSNRRYDVAWLLRGDRSLASSRLQGYLIHHHLAKSARARCTTRIILAPPLYLGTEPWTANECRLLANASRGTIVVLQKMFGPVMARLPHLVRAAGGKTVFVHSDYEPANEIPLDCDIVVTPSDALAADYVARGCKRVVEIPDPVDYSWQTPVTRPTKTKGLTIGWIGHHSNWETLSGLRGVLSEQEFSDFRLVTISDHPGAEIRWSLRAVPRLMPRFDLAVVPVGSAVRYRVKSANRVALFMAAGVPVIAGRIPAYESIVNHGCNGLLFSNLEELRECLREFRSAATRQSLATAAFEIARTQFTVAESARRWLELFDQLALELPESMCRENLEKRKSLQELQWRNSLAMFQIARNSARRWSAIRYALQAVTQWIMSPSPSRLREGLRLMMDALSRPIRRRLLRLKSAVIAN